MTRKYIYNQQFSVDRKKREQLSGHRSLLLWFTGLSGSGKSTLANAVEYELYKKGISTYVLDGDNVRGGLNRDLDFSPEDRSENIRRIAEVAHLLMDAGKVVLAAFIAPYEKDREQVRAIVGETNYIEIYVATPVEECERRDVKGLYAKARKGELSNFTGVSSPYEIPKNPDIVVNSDAESIDTAAKKILSFIASKIGM